MQSITILTPGDNSWLISPIEVSAIMYPGGDGMVRLTLVDRNQNILARQLLKVDAPTGQPVKFSTRLAFEIPAETSPAILTMTVQDQSHRTESLRSVKVTLAGSGESAIQPGTSTEPWLRITHPVPGEVIRESPIMVAGTVTPFNSQPIIFELVTERGGAIFSRQLAVGSPGQPMDFEVALVYPPVYRERAFLVTVRQPAGWGGLDAILDSLPIIIVPPD